MFYPDTLFLILTAAPMSVLAPTSVAFALAAGHLQVVGAATEPLTERPATEFPEGITACSLSPDASGWLADHALQVQDAIAGGTLADGAVAGGAAASVDHVVLVARCNWTEKSWLGSGAGFRVQRGQVQGQGQGQGQGRCGSPSSKAQCIKKLKARIQDFKLMYALPIGLGEDALQEHSVVLHLPPFLGRWSAEVPCAGRVACSRSTACRPWTSCSATATWQRVRLHSRTVKHPACHVSLANALTIVLRSCTFKTRSPTLNMPA